MDKLSKRAIAQLCASGAIQEDDREVYEYSLNILLISVLHTLTILLIGLALGMFLESVVLFASFFLIRKFAGGFHAPKHWQCYLFTIVSISGALLLARLLLTQNDIFFYALLGVQGSIIFLLAPAEHPNKPLSEKEKKVYRFVAWGLCFALAALSVVMLHWVSRSTGLALSMGLVLCAFSLVVAKAKRMIMRAL